jgi:hypothetical protein
VTEKTSSVGLVARNGTSLAAAVARRTAVADRAVGADRAALGPAGDKAGVGTSGLAQMEAVRGTRVAGVLPVAAHRALRVAIDDSGRHPIAPDAMRRHDPGHPGRIVRRGAASAFAMRDVHRIRAGGRGRVHPARLVRPARRRVQCARHGRLVPSVLLAHRIGAADHRGPDPKAAVAMTGRDAIDRDASSATERRVQGLAHSRLPVVLSHRARISASSSRLTRSSSPVVDPSRRRSSPAAKHGA